MAKSDHTAEIQRLTGVLTAKKGEFDTLGDAVTEELGSNGEVKGLVVSAEVRDHGTRLVNEMSEIKALIAVQEGALGIQRFLDAPDPAQVPAGSFMGSGLESKSIGELVTSSESWQNWKGGGFRGTGINIDRDLEGKSLAAMASEVKDLYTAVGGNFTVPAFGPKESAGITPRAHRRMRVRDMLLAGPTNSNLIEYIRVTGFANAAKFVAEREDASGNPIIGLGGVNFGLKPASDLLFEADSVPVRTIAHTIRAAKNVLDDEPRLQAIINSEMLYGLVLAEDAALLTGDGTNAGIVGLLNTPGVLNYTQRNDGAANPTATERKSAAIRRAMTLVILSFYDPSGVVVSPLDWEDIELETNAYGTPIFSMNLAIGAQKQVWRLPVTDTPAMASKNFLVGAFGIGARVWDRMTGTIEVSTEDRDNFVRNAVTIRAEERLALEVPRPEAFVHGTFIGEPAGTML